MDRRFDRAHASDRRDERTLNYADKRQAGSGRTVQLEAAVRGRLKYRKRKKQIVHAVRLTLLTDGFTYRKWGDIQRCKRGDWIVDNDGEVHTVDARTFAQTYQHRGDYLVFNKESGRDAYAVASAKFEKMYTRA